MSKTRRKRTRDSGMVEFATMPYRENGERYTVFLCRRCTKAWKLADPVDAWRVKNLVNHAASHKIDSLTQMVEPS
jgi:hypothetical protein